MSDSKTLKILSLATAAAGLLFGTNLPAKARFRNLLEKAKAQSAEVTVANPSKDKPAPLVLTNANNPVYAVAQHDSHSSHASHDSHASHASHASHSSGL